LPPDGLPSDWLPLTPLQQTLEVKPTTSTTISAINARIFTILVKGKPLLPLYL
jgi:hypothetical protein